MVAQAGAASREGGIRDDAIPAERIVIRSQHGGDGKSARCKYPGRGAPSGTESERTRIELVPGGG